MKVIAQEHSPRARCSLEGGTLALFPVPLLFFQVGAVSTIPESIRLLLAISASLCCVISGFTLYRHEMLGRVTGCLCLLFSLALVYNDLFSDPFVALLAGVFNIGAFFFLFTFTRCRVAPAGRMIFEQYAQRAWSASLVVLAFVVIDLMLGIFAEESYIYVNLFSFAIAQLLVLIGAYYKRSLLYLFFALFSLCLVALSYLYFGTRDLSASIFVFSLLTLFALPRGRFLHDSRESWWEVVLDHPARVLIVTFFALCCGGTFLLSFPFTAVEGTLSLLDAAFTSVSAVCVTGLSVVDVGSLFSFWGQFFLLLLIQLGGIGIMTITAVALHALGRRLSLRQERILSSMAAESSVDLFASLRLILRFTLWVEGVGALLLALGFWHNGDAWQTAIWRGIFTSISAFCNAGFALQSDSLIGYQNSPLILYVVSLLIIFGGTAPAVTMMLPSLLRRERVPVPARLMLGATLVLLIAGMLLFLAFEWSGTLASLSFWGKLNNAWFQSVTLRTAGFNSIDFSGMKNATFLLMLFWMFIGGNPGGTAGGVKTLAIAILALTFWRNATNHSRVTVYGRTIAPTTIFRAITLVISGMIIWFVVVMMLEVTQQISAKEIIFEATSALGTVGLTVGATPLLDEIGKIIIMLAMFVGRIGPMTLFMLLGNREEKEPLKRPELKISLT